jgi:hypothetical protein
MECAGGLFLVDGAGASEGALFSALFSDDLTIRLKKPGFAGWLAGVSAASREPLNVANSEHAARGLRTLRS